MSNPIPPLPFPDDDPERDDRPTVDVDGEEVLDPDADPAGIDSLAADRVASETEDADDDQDRDGW